MKRKNKFVTETVDDIVDIGPDGNPLEQISVSGNLFIFSNNPKDAPAESLLTMFYEGVLMNTLGIMRALNTETGQEELLLVGVQDEGDGRINTFPVAKVLGREAPAIYRSPDGKGGWFEPEKID